MKESRDILTLFEQLNSHEVFTPPRVARDMLSLLPKDIWCDPSIRILDPCVKSGVFLREALYLLIDGLAGKGKHVGHDGVEYDLNDGQQRMSHILKNMLFGIATSELTGYISRRTLYGVMEANTDKQTALIDAFEKSKSHKRWTEEEKVRFLVRNHFNEYYDHGLFNTPDYAGFEHEGNIFYPTGEVNKKVDDSDAFIIEDTYYPFIEEQVSHGKIQQIKDGQMKFDVVIGNPPYQISDGGSGNGISAKPVYHKFIASALSINPKFISMIVPSRWFAGGKGLNEFRSSMLSDRRFKVVVDYPNSKDCFPGVNIAGGVNYFLWDKTHNGQCCIKSGANKLDKGSFRFMDEFDVFIRDNIAAQIVSKMREESMQVLSEQAFARNPFGFDSKARGNSVEFEGSIRLHHSQGLGFVDRKTVLKNTKCVDKFKVTIGKVVPSNGEVDVTPEKGYRVITTPKIYMPGEIFTESYLMLGAFDSMIEAENFQYFMTQKIPRYLMKQTLTSMNISKSNFDFVPLLDWHKKWTDDDVAKHLGLTDEQWEHINYVMRPMFLDGGENA